MVVDSRRDSKTFGMSLGTELSDSGLGQIFMEGGFAHGFSVLKDFAMLHYKVTKEYESSDETGSHWCDKGPGISWPINAPIVSERDAGYPPLDRIGGASLPFSGG
jgi:dTDP-4-dehydrorhamnose 3,5-epimerase